MSTEKTPFGVTLLAIINIVVGIFGILAGISIDFLMSGGDLTLVSSFQLGAIFVGIFQIICLSAIRYI